MRYKKRSMSPKEQRELDNLKAENEELKGVISAIMGDIEDNLTDVNKEENDYE